MNFARFAPLWALLVTVPVGALFMPASAAAAESCTGPESETRLHVDVSNIRSTEGLIAVTLYADNPDKFLVRHGSLYVGRVAASKPVTPVCIFVPKPGTYAIAVYHDENANQKFDRKGIGLPAEGYGFSNNAPTLFGLPSFNSVRVKIERTDQQIAVKLKYP